MNDPENPTMKRLLHRNKALIILGITMLIGLVVAAAPIGGAHPRLPDEVLGLARIHEISLEFSPLSKSVRDAGLTDQKFQDEARKMLTDAGFKIAEGNKTPRLSFLILDLADKHEENVAGFSLFIDVVQKIRILRLDAVFTMPTTTLYFHKLSAYNRLNDDVINGLHHLLGQFIKWEKQATTIGQ